MKHTTLLILLILILLFSASCDLSTQIVEWVSLPATETPAILADSFFSGVAYIDTNQNNKIDPNDEPLEGALFTAIGFGDYTNAKGSAFITIPGGWEEPVNARMQAPEDSKYSLISPGEVILQSGKKSHAEYLFANTEGNPSSKPSSTPNPTGPSGSNHPFDRLEIDIPYCITTDGIELTMDLYHPKISGEPSPAVVYVHGGGWVNGDKSDGVGLVFSRQLVEEGYTFIAINYRLSPTHQFPAHIEDVRCAIRHLRANAKNYHIDPARIGVIGGSAGGHLVSLLGLSDESPNWESEDYYETYFAQSNRVQAIVDLFGPTDLLKLYPNSRSTHREEVFGVTSIDDPLIQFYSPVTHITPDDPPFLIIQGLEDKTVPPDQSQVLYDGLVAAGVPATLVMVDHAGHSLRPVDGDIIPSLLELQQMVLEFYNQYLK